MKRAIIGLVLLSACSSGQEAWEGSVVRDGGEPVAMQLYPYPRRYEWDGYFHNRFFTAAGWLHTSDGPQLVKLVIRTEIDTEPAVGDTCPVLTWGDSVSDHPCAMFVSYVEQPIDNPDRQFFDWRNTDSDGRADGSFTYEEAIVIPDPLGLGADEVVGFRGHLEVTIDHSEADVAPGVRVIDTSVYHGDF